MSRAIKLVGLDCGSTTTSCLVAGARLVPTSLGKVEISGLEVLFRSEVVFTPFAAGSLDVLRLAHYLDDWLAQAATTPQEIFGGGALITGLAAEKDNATAVASLIERRMAESVIATADQPRLESWLAFMGNCHTLSKAHPDTPILNIDIGGGTTNLALGLDGQVLGTGALFVGARHFQFEPGTYRCAAISSHGQQVLDHLQVCKEVGDEFSAREIGAIVSCCVDWIEAAAGGNTHSLDSPSGPPLLQVPLTMPRDLLERAAITLSGGVGQLVYQRLPGAAQSDTTQPATSKFSITQFGDLGGELAARLIASPNIATRLGTLVPEGLGRATVFGLLKHSTELSGSTIYLPQPERLPLSNVPIVGRIGPASSDEQLAAALELARQATPAACLQVELDATDVAGLRDLGARLARLLEARPFAREQTLLFLLPANLGKALGNYIAKWGTLEMNIVVVDEVPPRDAQFVRLGRLREGLVPLWLYAAR